MAEYGERLNTYRSRSADGGVNNKLFGIDIADNEAVELRNIDISVPGLRQKRMGTTITASGFSGGKMLALTHFAPAVTIGNRRLLAISRAAGDDVGGHKELWSWEGSGNWSHVGTLSGVTGGEDFSWIHGFDLNIDGGYVVAMISNNTVDCYWYNGATLGRLAYGGGQPDGHIGDFFNGRALISGAQGSNRRHKVYFSDVVSFTVTGFGNPQFRAFDMGGGTGQRVIAIKGFRGQDLIVFFEDRIEALVMTDAVTASGGAAVYADPRQAWSRQVIHTSIGCGSRNTVVNVGQDLYFMDQYGEIRSLARTINDASQGVESVPISDKIKSTIDRITKVNLRRACAAYYQGKYLFAIPVEGDIFPSEIWVYDITLNAWSGPWDNISPRAFVVGDMDNSSAQEEDQSSTLWYLKSSTFTDQYVGRMFRGTRDAGDPITYQEVTKRYDFGQLESDKIWHRFEPMMVATASMGVLVEAIPDAGTPVTLGVFNPEGGSVLLPQALPYIIGSNVIVFGKLTMEDVSRSRDVQIRLTVTTGSSVKYIGHSVGGWVEGVDDTVVEGS